jgi:hypothetical protein
MSKLLSFETPPSHGTARWPINSVLISRATVPMNPRISISCCSTRTAPAALLQDDSESIRQLKFITTRLVKPTANHLPSLFLFIYIYILVYLFFILTTCSAFILLRRRAKVIRNDERGLTYMKKSCSRSPYSAKDALIRNVERDR